VTRYLHWLKTIAGRRVVVDRVLICVADIPAAAGGVCDSTVIICARYGQVVTNEMCYNM